MKIKYIILFCVFIVANNIYANTYYVATNGNDNSTGLENQAWKTIQKAANTLVAGDTVFIKTGTYKERVVVQNSGTNDNYIVFANYENNEVIIDGQGLDWYRWEGLFDIINKSYIEVKGLTIKNSYYAGIWVEKSHHINIEDNYTNNTFSSGIGVWESTNIRVALNEVELACNDIEGVQECITVAKSSNCIVFKNHVHHNGPGTLGGEGIDIKQGSHDIKVYENHVHDLNLRIGIYVDAWDTLTYNIDILQNQVHHCTNSGITIQTEMGGILENVNIFNNVSFYNKWDGIAIGSVVADTLIKVTPVKHVKIINNTCYNNGSIDGGWGFGILVDNPDAEDIVIRNNICSQNNAQIAIQNIKSGAVVDHNLIYGNNDVPDTVYGSDSIVADPLIDTLAVGPFYIGWNSPAIDKGSILDAPDRDIVNNIRPFGDAVDIGAYETHTTLAVQDDFLFENNINIYPNPFRDQLSVRIKDGKNKKYRIKLFDVYGRLVKSFITTKIQNETIIIEGNNLLPGLYILNIQLGNQVVMNKKLIID